MTAVRWILTAFVFAAGLWSMAWIGFQYDTHLAFFIVIVLILLVTEREPGDWFLAGAVLAVAASTTATAIWLHY